MGEATRRMLRAVLLVLPLLLVSASAGPAERPQGRIFLHMLGGLLSGGETTTTVGPSTTKATLYGDLVNLWDMLFGEKDSTTTELTTTTTTSTTPTTTTTTTTTTTPATTTTTKCGGIFGGGLGLGCPNKLTSNQLKLEYW